MSKIETPRFQFGNVVVVDGRYIGLVVKTWGKSRSRGIHYEVYVRMANAVMEYDESDIRHFVYDKVIGDDEWA